MHASPRLTSFDLVFLAHKGAQILTGPAVRTHAKFVLAADMLVLYIVKHRTCLLWPRVSVRRATLEMRLARTPTAPGTISAVPVTALDDTVDGLDRTGDRRCFRARASTCSSFARCSLPCGSPGFRRVLAFPSDLEPLGTLNVLSVS